MAIHWHQNLSGAQQSHSREILSYLLVPLPQSSIQKKNIPGRYWAICRCLNPQVIHSVYLLCVHWILYIIYRNYASFTKHVLNKAIWLHWRPYNMYTAHLSDLTGDTQTNPPDLRWRDIATGASQLSSWHLPLHIIIIIIYSELSPLLVANSSVHFTQALGFEIWLIPCDRVPVCLSPKSAPKIPSGHSWKSL